MDMAEEERKMPKYTRNQLIKFGWEMFTKYGLNCELWKRGKEMLLWNRITHKVYYY